MKDAQPWWVAKDLCDVLEIKNSRQTLSYLDDDEKGVITNDTLGGAQEMSIVNEPGMYSLVLKSRKPEAKSFTVPILCLLAVK
jgi:prophage antirepressor-like protein